MQFKDRWRQEKLKKKTQRGFRGYPVATIAYYGQDAQRASKVVVGIILAEGDDADPMSKWFSETTDVRADATIQTEIVQFIHRHAPKSVVATDGIIGCPHEEGIDYPDSEKCPQWPYWASRDRWSGETST